MRLAQSSGLSCGCKMKYWPLLRLRCSALQFLLHLKFGGLKWGEGVSKTVIYWEKLHSWECYHRSELCGPTVLLYCGWCNVRIIFVLQKCLLACKMISLLTLLVLSSLQLEAGGQEEPFILPSGAHYRDVLTVRTASLAAAFAKMFQSRVSSEARRIRDNLGGELRPSERTPVFLGARSLSQIARKGRIMPDEEIFDFTDSRFLNPPRENVRNHPTVEVIEVEGQRFATPSPPHPPPLPALQNSPHRRPTPQPIFQLPENFINDISPPRNPSYRKTIPPFVSFGGKTSLSHLSPSPTPVNDGYGQQIFKPHKKYIKTLPAATKRKGSRKVFFNKLS